MVVLFFGFAEGIVDSDVGLLIDVPRTTVDYVALVRVHPSWVQATFVSVSHYETSLTVHLLIQLVGQKHWSEMVFVDCEVSVLA